MPTGFQYIWEIWLNYLRYTQTFTRTSTMATSQSQIPVLKGNEGAVEIADNPSALQRRMIAEPEVRVIWEFEFWPTWGWASGHNITMMSAEIICQGFCSLVTVIEDLGNPLNKRASSWMLLMKLQILLYCKQFVVLRMSVRISLTPLL